jgi:hypothetical protein
MTQTDSPERIAERICNAHAYFGTKTLQDAIAQALADERRRVREECAGIADQFARENGPGDVGDRHGEVCEWAGEEIASAIRAAGKE